MEELAKLPIRTAARIVCREYLPACNDSLPQVLLLIDEFLTLVDFPNQTAFDQACEGGASVQVLELLLKGSARSWQYPAGMAALHGHLHILRWMLSKRQDRRGPWRSELEVALVDAASSGHLEIVQLLYEDGIRKMTNYAMCLAACYEHLNVMEWLHNRGANYQIGEVFGFAAQNGQLAAVQWLHRHRLSAAKFDDATNFKAIDPEAIDLAAENGHLDVVQWLYKNHYGSCSHYAVESAAEHGYLDVVKWLYVRHGTRCSAITFTCTCSLDVMEWIKEQYGVDYIQRQIACGTLTMDEAAEDGKLDVVKWLHSHNGVFWCTTKAMDGAAKNGKLEMMQWLHTHRQEGCTTDAMDEAAGSGHLAIVKWLHENRSEGCTTNAMDMAANNGHLDVLHRLYEHRSEGCSSVALWISEQDHYEVISWLLEKYTSRFELSTITMAAIDAARFDHLRTVQLLASHDLFHLFASPECLHGYSIVRLDRDKCTWWSGF